MVICGNIFIGLLYVNDGALCIIIILLIVGN